MTEPDNPRRMPNLRQAAAYAGVSRWTLLNWVIQAGAATPGDEDSMRMTIQTLQSIIDRREKELQALQQVIDILTARTPPPTTPSIPSPPTPPPLTARPPTIAEQVEDLLESHGELHIDEIRKMLAARKVKVKRKNLSNILNRWIARGEIFRRPRPNTFALQAKKKKEEEEEEE